MLKGKLRHGTFGALSSAVLPIRVPDFKIVARAYGNFMG